MTVFSAKPLFLATAVTVGLSASAVSAGVVFQTGNIQYTNVNIAADIHAFTVVGEVDHLGVYVFFEGFGAAPTRPPVELHGQHGVAFIEAQHPAEELFMLTLQADVGYAFANVDWKLDAVPPNDGFVSFSAFDAGGNLIGSSADFAFSHNGQNPFHLHADANTPVFKLVMTSTVPILDLKQVSVNLVPSPGTMGGLALSLLVATRRRR